MTGRSAQQHGSRCVRQHRLHFRHQLTPRGPWFHDSPLAVSGIGFVARAQQSEALQQIDVAAYRPQIAIQSAGQARHRLRTFFRQLQNAHPLRRKNGDDVIRVLEGDLGSAARLSPRSSLRACSRERSENPFSPRRPSHTVFERGGSRRCGWRLIAFQRDFSAVRAH